MKTTSSALALLPLLMLTDLATANTSNIIRLSAPISASLASPEEPEPVPEPELALTSCKAIKEKTPGSASGVYTIKSNGADLDVYCDMVAEGGGWTLIVAQYDSNPVTDWAGGLKADYDPSLAIKSSFTLASAQIPSHSQTAFGENHSATTVGYANYIYSVNDLPSERVVNLKTGAYYWIHRNTGHVFANHQPNIGAPVYQSGPDSWGNTLTFSDESSGFTWAFSPLVSPISYRSYALNGSRYSHTYSSTAWTVWVR